MSGFSYTLRAFLDLGAINFEGPVTQQQSLKEELSVTMNKLRYQPTCEVTRIERSSKNKVYSGKGLLEE